MLAGRRVVAGDDLFLALLGSRVFLNKKVFPGEGVFLGVIHHTGIGGRCGREDLHLLGQHIELLAGEAFESLHVFLRAAGIGGDEIIAEKLFFPYLPIDGIKTLFEFK